MTVNINVLRMNVAGVISVSALILFLAYSGSLPFSPILFLFLMSGVVLTKAAHLWGRGATPAFIFAVLWVGYWSFVVDQGFTTWELFALTQSGWFIFWLSLGIGVWFAALAGINLLTLFLIQKPK